MKVNCKDCADQNCEYQGRNEPHTRSECYVDPNETRTPIQGIKPYSPSNGTEGIGFLECWCWECERERLFRKTDEPEHACEICTLSMVYSIKDKEYPPEWVYNECGEPVCMSFMPELTDEQVRADKDIQYRREAEKRGQLILIK